MAGVVAQLDEGGEALAHHRAVCLQRGVAMGDGDRFPTLDLQEGLVLADKEAALVDMRQRRRGREGDEGRGARSWVPQPA